MNYDTRQLDELNDEEKHTLTRLQDVAPASLTEREACYILRLKTYQLRAVVHEGIIKPLGKPGKNAPKWYSRIDVYALRDNPALLSKAHLAIQKFNRSRNGTDLDATQKINAGWFGVRSKNLNAPKRSCMPN